MHVLALGRTQLNHVGSNPTLRKAFLVTLYWFESSCLGALEKTPRGLSHLALESTQLHKLSRVEGRRTPAENICAVTEGDAAARRSETSGSAAEKPVPLNPTSPGTNAGARGVSGGGSPCLMPGPRSGSRMALPSQVTGRADLQKGKTDVNTLEGCVVSRHSQPGTTATHVASGELPSPRRPQKAPPLSPGPRLRPPPCPRVSSLSIILSVWPLSALMGRRKRAQQLALGGGTGRSGCPGRAGLCLGRVVTTRRAGTGPTARL